MTAEPALVATATVVLDQERTLVEDFGALALLEQKTAEKGMPVNTINAFSIGNLNAQQLAWRLWALLRHEDPQPTFEQCGAWCTSPVTGPRIQQALGRLKERTIEIARDANPDLFADLGKGADQAPLDQSGGDASPPSPASASD